MEKKQSERSYAAPALSRGLRILEFLSKSEEACSQMRIARALGHTHAEIFRLLSVLEQEGYIVRVASGEYSASLKLFQIGSRIDAAKKLIQVARGPMRRFCAEYGQECHLSRLQDGRLIVLAQQTSEQPFTLRVRVGSDHDPRKNVSGRLLLAQLDIAERDWHLRRAHESFPGPHPSLKSLERQFTAIREEGFSASEDESIIGVSDTAVLVGGGYTTSCMAALASSTLNGQSTSKRKQSLVGSLMETAEAISQGFAD